MLLSRNFNITSYWFIVVTDERNFLNEAVLCKYELYRIVRAVNRRESVFFQAGVYEVNYDIIAYTSVADTVALVAQSKARVKDLIDANGLLLGLDVIVSEINAAAKVAGVADVIIHSPVANIAIDKTQVARCTSLAATLTGFNNDRK